MIKEKHKDTYFHLSQMLMLKNPAFLCRVKVRY